MMRSIQELRRSMGLTQKEFSYRYEIPLDTLKKWEQGVMSPAPYVVRLLANTIPCEDGDFHEVQVSDGSVYYYDDTRKIIIDREGNTVHYHGSLDEVKEENLPLYIEDLFQAVHQAKEKFDRDVDYDREEDIIWTRL